MLVIRYNRTGRRNKPFFRLVVQEKTIAPGGRHAEVVGSWDPHAKIATLKEDRIKHWLSVGAQPSDSVYNLLVTKGLIEGKKRAVKIPKKDEEQKDGEIEESNSNSEEPKDGVVEKEESQNSGEVKEEKKEESIEKPEEEKKEEEKKE